MLEHRLRLGDTPDSCIACGCKVRGRNYVGAQSVREATAGYHGVEQRVGSSAWSFEAAAAHLCNTLLSKTFVSEQFVRNMDILRDGGRVMGLTWVTKYLEAHVKLASRHCDAKKFAAIFSEDSSVLAPHLAHEENCYTEKDIVEAETSSLPCCHRTHTLRTPTANAQHMIGLAWVLGVRNCQRLDAKRQGL